MSKLAADSQTSSARVLHETLNDGKIYFKTDQGTSQDVVIFKFLCLCAEYSIFVHCCKYSLCSVPSACADTQGGEIWWVGVSSLGKCERRNSLWKHLLSANVTVQLHRWKYIKYKPLDFQGPNDLFSCPFKWVGERVSNSWVFGMIGNGANKDIEQSTKDTINNVVSLPALQKKSHR